MCEPDRAYNKQIPVAIENQPGPKAGYDLLHEHWTSISLLYGSTCRAKAGDLTSGTPRENKDVRAPQEDWVPEDSLAGF